MYLRIYLVISFIHMSRILTYIFNVYFYSLFIIEYYFKKFKFDRTNK